MFKSLALAAIITLPLGIAPASAGPYAEQFVRTIGTVNPTSVGAIVNGLTDVQVNRLDRSCHGSLSVRTSNFCSLLEDELDDEEKQDRDG